MRDSNSRTPVGVTVLPVALGQTLPILHGAVGHNFSDCLHQSVTWAGWSDYEALASWTALTAISRVYLMLTTHFQSSSSPFLVVAYVCVH